MHSVENVHSFLSLFIQCHCYLPAYFADDNAILIDRMEGVGHNGHYDFELVNF